MAEDSMIQLREPSTQRHSTGNSSQLIRMSTGSSTVLAQRPISSSSALAQIHHSAALTGFTPPPTADADINERDDPAWLLSRVQEQGGIIGGSAYYVGPDQSGDVDKILLEAEDEIGQQGAESEHQERAHTRRLARAAVLRERGNAAVRAGVPEAALAHYSESLALVPNDPAALRNRAHAHLELGDWAAAEADCTHALQFEPDNPRALYRRAVARHYGRGGGVGGRPRCSVCSAEAPGRG